MKSVTPTLPTNPFEKDVVHEPRDHPPSVSSLNQETLDKLLSQFKNVESFGESPTRKAELILSPAPGYGKSHLVGRFFKELGNQAVRVYIPRNCLEKSHLRRNGCARKRTFTHQNEAVPVNMLSMKIARAKPS